MFGIVVLIALFICVCSIFFPELRKISYAILTTGAIAVGGFLIFIQLLGGWR